MRQHGAERVIVTTPAGQFLGMVERQAIERRLAMPPHSLRVRLPPGLPGIEIGYKLSCEEHGPSDLVRYARQAEDAGFTFAMLSDHYHPWIAQQGQSPFVWSVLGSIAQATERLHVGTGVTCPLIRLHPAIVAQAAATAAALLPGRFVLAWGLGRASTNISLAPPGRPLPGGAPCWRRRWRSFASSGKGACAATSALTEEAIAQAVVCGPDPARHIAAITQAAEAGYTHVWVHQIGPDQAGFFEFYASDVLPQLRLR
jgi:hypothetical protein